jgi:hypothetical protein
LTTPDGVEQLRLQSFAEGDDTIGALALRLPRGVGRTTNAGASVAAPLEFTA